VSVTGYSYSLDALVIKATSELSKEFPFNLDYNSGKPLGLGQFLFEGNMVHLTIFLGWTQSAIRKGERVSSATAYLAPNILKRPNLHVLIGAYASRVSSSKPKGDTDTVTFTQPGYGSMSLASPCFPPS
jgi:hypothetical protein